MAYFSEAIKLIKKYEGFNEKAYADPTTGAYPYTIGFGSQFYPDGSLVKPGQRCSKKKALEYLEHEIKIIDEQLNSLELSLDNSMRQALISFIHSVGWQSFLYSSIVDAIERSDYKETIDLMYQWVLDAKHQVVGNLIQRRREENHLFLQEIKESSRGVAQKFNSVLLRAFREYDGSPLQLKAIKTLEDQINPYTLSEFANNFLFSLESEEEEYLSHDFD
jgi:lysozyme